jgi:hypothetical protein
MKALGVSLREMNFPKIGNDKGTVVAKSLKIAENVLAVGKGATEQIERFALARLVIDRLDDLKEDYPDATDNNMASIREEATALLNANAYKAIPAPKVEPKPEPQPVAQNNNNGNNWNNNNNGNNNNQNMQNFNNRLQQLLRGGGGGGGGFTGGSRRGGGGRGRG